MKKTYIMNFEHTKDCEIIKDAFGIDHEDIIILANNILEDGRNDITEIIVDFLEKEKVTGNEIMAAACIGLQKLCSEILKTKERSK